jgi:hypothetical protein
MPSIFDRHWTRGEADAFQARGERLGNHIAKLQAAGICTHGWLQGTPGNANGPQTCNHCGAKFASFDEAAAAGKAAMRTRI